ncbi:DMT family transporter [Thermodesulfobacteriota bacterium]
MKQSLLQFVKESPALKITVGAIMISFSSVFVKLSHVTPTVAGFYRVLFGGIFLVFIALRVNMLTRPKPLQGFLAGVCGVLFAFDLFTWHHSINYVGPGLATIIVNFQVFILALIGILFLGEKLSIKFGLSIPLAFLGLYMIVGIRWEQLGPDYKYGILLGLAAAGFYSIFLLVLRKLQSATNEIKTITNLMLVSFTTALFLGGEAVRNAEPLKIPDTQTWMALLSYGLLGQVIGWLCISHALPKMRASAAGLILLLQPALSFVWDVLFFGREAGLTSVVGVGITLTAIYLGSTR